MKLRNLVVFGFLFSLLGVSQADFMIKKIKVEGLQRVSLGTFLNYLPLKEGEYFDEKDTGLVIKALHRTGFFKDIKLFREKGLLVVRVVEHPVLGAVKITGNKEIDRKWLKEILASAQVKEGNTVDPVLLQKLSSELLGYCNSIGLYSAKVDFVLKDIQPGKQELTIQISEGAFAKVKEIHFTGNRLFDVKQLRSVMELKPTHWLSWWNKDDRYSVAKLEGDCGRVHNYYLDRGYLHMQILDKRAEISEDGRSVVLTFQVDEGERFIFQGVDLSGELLGRKEELLKAISVKTGDYFSRQKVMESRLNLMKVLGDLGYGVAEVEIDYREEGNRVTVLFGVQPRQRTYLRKIDFRGNNRTLDPVLRREMRLQEGSLFSNVKIHESSRRLANLGYLEQLDHEVIPVEGTNNQVDLVYHFKEVSDVTFSAQAGFSDSDGLIGGVSLVDRNLLGSGKVVGIRANFAKTGHTFGYNYYNPYCFKNSQLGYGFSVSYSQSNPSKIDDHLSAYQPKTFSVMNSFDLPLSDYVQMGYGIGFEHVFQGSVSRRGNPRAEQFLKKYGTKFNHFKLVWDIRYSNLDRAIFPRKGLFASAACEVYLPAFQRSLSYYKLHGHAGYYQPLYKDWILRLGGEVGYGKDFGRNKELPFFKNFYAGGLGSVRGFEPSTISNKADKGKVIGGNALVLANASLIFPNPWPEVLRVSLFVDAGSVFNKKVHFSDLRVSTGVQVEWKTPIAPLIFSFGKPIRKFAWDERRSFQFSISTEI